MKSPWLVLVFWVMLASKALPQSAFDFEQIDAPTIGSLCPNYRLLGLDGTKYQLHNYRGQVVLLEFWATSCRPCIPAMTHLEILEAEFPQQLKVFQVTSEDAPTVQRFLGKHPVETTIVLDTARKLHQAFYHHFLPHTVIIDAKGIVRAFTYPGEITPQVVRQLLKNQPIKVRTKQEYNNQSSVSLGLSQQLDEVAAVLDDRPVIVVPERKASAVYQAQITPYRQGEETQIVREGEYHIRFINCPLTLIYQTLYGVSSNRMLLEVPEDKVMDYTFEEKNALCFDLSVPDSLGHTMQAYAQQQLADRFVLKAKVEERERPLYVLSVTKNIKADPNTNQTFQSLIEYLEVQPETEGLATVLETSLNDQTAFDLKAFQQKKGTLEQRLAQCGLKIEKQIRPAEYLILYQ